MARIRSIQPSLFSDEAWTSCSPMTRLLFIGLGTEADDNGIFEWRPRSLKLRLFPGDNVEVQEMLDELVSAGLVMGFTAEGKMFGAIKDFKKVQRPQKPRAQWPITPEAERFVCGIVEDQPELFSDRYDTSQRNAQPRRGEERKGIGEEGSRKRAKPEVQIPEGYPDQPAIEYATQRFVDAKVQVGAAREAEKFRNHHMAKGTRFKDWAAAWRTWIGNAIDYAQRDGRVIELAERAPDPGMRDHVWRTWLSDWMRAPHQWRTQDRGPTPDEPGCRIPKRIMDEMGFTPGQRGARLG